MVSALILGGRFRAGFLNLARQADAEGLHRVQVFGFRL